MEKDKKAESENKRKRHHITAVWLDWGFRLNLKLFLYLETFCLTEK